VLRFGGFYGPDAPSTLETAQLVRRRMLPQIGSGCNYMPSIYVPDAGRAVAAALAAPAGIYNICDDTPVPFAEYLRAVVEALGAPRPRRLPAALGRLLFGEVGRYIFRSLRVSNRRFREAAGWAPEVGSVSQGWPRIAAEWRVSAPAGAGG
jgi:nucleoside-diphosphate-sugar epimerase